MSDRIYRGESLNRKIADIYRKYDHPSQIIAAAYAEGMTTNSPTFAARYLAMMELQEDELNEFYDSCDGCDLDQIIKRIETVERMAI